MFRGRFFSVLLLVLFLFGILTAGVVSGAFRRPQVVVPAYYVSREDIDSPLQSEFVGLDRELYDISSRLLREFSAYEKSPSSDRLTSLVSLARERKTLMQGIISRSPRVFLRNVFTSRALSRLRSVLGEYLESDISLSRATLEVFHIDQFQEQRSSEEYFLWDVSGSGRRFAFHPVGELPTLLSGSIAQVSGYALGNDLVVDAREKVPVFSAGSVGSPSELFTPDIGIRSNMNASQNEFRVLQEAVPDAVGNQRVLVVLLRPEDIPLDSLPTKEEMASRIFDGDIQAYFRENSYGKMSLSGDVVGWYTVPAGVDAYNFQLFSSLSIADRDVDYRNYDRVMYGVAGGYGGASLVGKFPNIHTGDGELSLSFSTFFVPVDGVLNSSVDFVFAHEFGHALGVLHANLWQCEYSILGDDCKHIEYGNSFDTMGRSFQLTHFNAYFKEALGWVSLREGSLIDVSSPGTYALRPLELKDVIVGKIEMNSSPDLPSYYFEYRQPIGFDKSLGGRFSKGALINERRESLQSMLLNMTPGVDVSLLPFFLFGAPLQVGQLFQHENLGFAVRTLRSDSDSLTISVSKSSCGQLVFDSPESSVTLFTPANSSSFESVTRYWRFGSQDGLVDEKTDSGTFFTHYDPDLERRVSLDQLVISAPAGREYGFFVQSDVRHLGAAGCPAMFLEVALRFPPEFSLVGSGTSSVFILSQTVARVISNNVVVPPSVPAGQYPVRLEIRNPETGDTVSRDIQVVLVSPGDVTGDGCVNIVDLVTIARKFGQKVGAGAVEDVSRDGVVNIVDLVMVARDFGKGQCRAVYAPPRSSVGIGFASVLKSIFWAIGE